MKAQNFLLQTICFVLSFTATCSAQYKHDSLKIEHGYLHYYVKGTGKPILHLQGGPGFSYYYMRDIADSLNNYENILIDYEGTGLSQYRKPDTSWVSIDNVISNIEAVRKKLGIKKWIIDGHSAGSTFALYYTVKFPQRVSKLISISTCGSNWQCFSYLWNNILTRLSEQDTIMLDKAQSDSTMNPSLKAAITMRIVLNAYFYNKSLIQVMIAALPESEHATYLNPQFNKVFESGSGFNQFNIDKEVQNIKIPVLMIQGRQDPIGEAAAILLKQKLSNCKLTFINKCGHFPWIEEPKEFFSLVNEFLKE